MPIYVFYPNRPDGVAATFEAHELACDRTAMDRAADILKRYKSSSSVAVWEGERQVAIHAREPA